MTGERIVFEGGRVVDPANRTDEVRDVVVADGVIAGPEATEGAERIDARGLVIAPGLVDLHTHLREPGFEHKETVETGTRAAATGGFTAVASMANTDPVTDHAAIVHEVRDLAAAAGLADVFPVGAITKGRAGESLAEMGEMVDAGVRVFSDDGDTVSNARLLRNALMYAKAFPVEIVLADHAEDASLVEGGHMHEGSNSYAMGVAGRPAAAEEIAVARDLAVARATGGAAAPVPPLVGEGGRARPGGEGRGAPRDRGGHAASPDVHRRRRRHLRHEPQDEPSPSDGG